ncbi:anaphase-promoting complex subunit 2 isoform X1 [Brassica rapa]|uniref:anaphase-promoting complex subunit 2 isoform X1 n=1 Tax=Brassica campestris TaxID=3711 RepID=UPI0006AA6CDD|nr:anaphase-promoting complex subunit 2 isoform X1 [Brassica rapa]XP_033146494.1 anaphase-promoting complex subunit 2 isoform X1 [Brassica rapa]XP_048633409.1 anaphase-promoting complex subunit 2 isoform X1 [Brassica napus]
MQLFEYNLETLSDDAIREITESYDGFFTTVESLIAGAGDFAVEKEFVSHVSTLCNYGLDSLVCDHFLRSLEQAFDKSGASSFGHHFDDYSDKNHTDCGEEVHQLLSKALEEISTEKQYNEKCISMVVHALQSFKEKRLSSDAERAQIFSRFQSMLSSTLMTTLPQHFPEILHCYFKEKLEELSTIMDEDDAQQLESDGMDLDVDEGYSRHDEFVKNIGKVVCDLRSLGFTSMAENAYASAIFLLLKSKVHDLAGDDYRTSVLGPIKEWIQTVPLQFLSALLCYIGDSISYDTTACGLTSPLDCCPSPSFSKVVTPSQGIGRWKLLLEYFAYETLQDLRIAKLFEIIVDYPESSPAIEDLKQCLEYTRQHSKLVESFISSLKYRLLTAGASTNDIFHQYVLTIKAFRAIDPSGVFLEPVAEPIRDYLRGRKDTIKCIVTMLTDGSGGNRNGSGNPGDSLLEELMRDEENQENVGFDDDFHTDDKQAWINASRWEPDPLEAGPSKGSLSERKVDILGMLVDIIGSSEQLVNEYRVMLAEKLLNKIDYDIETEIRTVELLKVNSISFFTLEFYLAKLLVYFLHCCQQIHFGEASMQRCEIMLNDLIDSKRVNTNIKKTSQTGAEVVESELSVDILTSKILSTNFWPPIQDEPLELPAPIDKLLSDYANRYHEIKTPRKLLWKKNLGTVKLELQFEDRAMQFTVSPTHAAIIMQFQEKKIWTSIDLAAAIGIPIDLLNRRVNFWISQGVLRESNANVFTLVESMTNSGKNESEEILASDEESERSIAYVEDQLRKETTIYKNFIMAMLTNGSMAVDGIHNRLKMFYVADPAYDKSLQQLQSFLSRLVAEEKLELRDGMYLLKK